MWHYFAISLTSYIIAHGISQVRSFLLSDLNLNALHVRFVSSGLRVISLTAFILAVGRAFDVNVTNLYSQLITSASVVVGFAAQDVLKNFASGLVIMASTPFQVGDKINIDGKTGKVIEVGFFSTHLKCTTNTGLCIPNSKVVSSVLRNEDNNYGIAHVNNGLRRVAISVHLSVKTDLDKAVKVLEGVGKEMDHFIEGLNSDPKVKEFKGHGRHTLAEYHLLRYKQELAAEQKDHPSEVELVGQNIASGFELELRCMADSMLTGKVHTEGFKRSVKALQAAGVEFFQSA